MKWRFLDSGALAGAGQMAIDSGLMHRARETGEAVFRVYAWDRPTLSFGRHETVRGRFDPATLAAANVSAVRRPTGGRVLMHDREVTYSVTMPARDDELVSATYHAINSLLISALAQLGVVASEAPVGQARVPGGAACFAEPSEGELTIDGRKLVGSAQLREHGALLQHGSILIHDDQPRIAALAAQPLVPAIPAATLAAALGHTPLYSEVRDALCSALERAGHHPDALGPDEAAEFAAPHRERFASAEWTWRR